MCNAQRKGGLDRRCEGNGTYNEMRNEICAFLRILFCGFLMTE